MVSMQNSQAIPGVYICRACYYNALGTEPAQHTSSALAFSIDGGMKLMFKKPTTVEQYQQHHMWEQ